jgi:hypothetical protein
MMREGRKYKMFDFKSNGLDLTGRFRLNQRSRCERQIWKATILPIAIALLCVPASLFADENQEAKAAYCKFITEQAEAQRDLLRAPSAVLDLIQPSTGTPAQVAFGLQTSLSDQKKARLSMDAAKTGCAAYNAATDAQQHITYALPNLEKIILRHRRELIEQTADKLDGLIAENMKLVQAHNLSRPSLYALQSAKLRLDMNLTATATEISSSYVPELSDTPLRVLVGEKVMADIRNQVALDRLEKQNGWDIKLAGGARRQISPNASTISPFGAYGELNIQYNFGQRAVNEHLDASDVAYSDWKKNQFEDVVQQAALLEKQIVETIKTREDQLKSLQEHDAQVQKELNSLQNVETSTALTYRDQLIADQLVLQVDIKDLQFRLTQLYQYLKDNFDDTYCSHRYSSCIPY